MADPRRDVLTWRVASCVSLPRSRRGGASLLVTAIVLLAGCAGLATRLSPPKVDVVAVRLDRVQDARAAFGVTVALTNPNPQPIDVQAFDAALAVEGEVVATAALVAPVRVPGNGTATAELAAVTGVDALLRAGVAGLRPGA